MLDIPVKSYLKGKLTGSKASFSRVGSSTDPVSLPASQIVDELNADGGVAVIGGGLAGLSAALASRKQGCEVTVYTPTIEPTLYPLLNFREGQKDYLLGLGVDPNLFSSVQGIARQSVSKGNMFREVPTVNIFYKALITNLIEICKRQGVNFVDQNIAPSDLGGIAEKSGSIVLATGGSRTSKNMLAKLEVSRAEEGSLRDLRIPVSEQKYVSALLQDSNGDQGKGRVQAYRHHETGGAVVAIRQENTELQNHIWLNIQVPQNETDGLALVKQEAIRLFGKDINLEHVTSPFIIKPRLTQGQGNVSQAQTPTIKVNGSRSVPVLLLGDIGGSGGFRNSAGAGGAVAQAEVLERMLEETDTEDLDTWSQKVNTYFRRITLDRLEAEGAIISGDVRHFTGSRSPEGLKQISELDPLATKLFLEGLGGLDDSYRPGDLRKVFKKGVFTIEDFFAKPGRFPAVSAIKDKVIPHSRETLVRLIEDSSRGVSHGLRVLIKESPHLLEQSDIYSICRKGGRSTSPEAFELRSELLDSNAMSILIEKPHPNSGCIPAMKARPDLVGDSMLARAKELKLSPEIITEMSSIISAKEASSRELQPYKLPLNYLFSIIIFFSVLALIRLSNTISSERVNS